MEGGGNESPSPVKGTEGNHRVGRKGLRPNGPLGTRSALAVQPMLITDLAPELPEARYRTTTGSS